MDDAERNRLVAKADQKHALYRERVEEMTQDIRANHLDKDPMMVAGSVAVLMVETLDLSIDEIAVMFGIACFKLAKERNG